MEKVVEAINHERIEKAVDRNVKVAFIEALVSYQLMKIASDETIDIKKDDDHVQMLGAELLTNTHVLYSLNISVTRYVQAEAGKALAGIRESPAKGQSYVKATFTRTVNRLNGDITALLQKRNNCMTDINRPIQLSKLDTHNDNRNL